jgi:hypothetical protein
MRRDGVGMAGMAGGIAVGATYEKREVKTPSPRAPRLFFFELLGASFSFHFAPAIRSRLTLDSHDGHAWPTGR